MLRLQRYRQELSLELTWSQISSVINLLSYECANQIQESCRFGSLWHKLWTQHLEQVFQILEAKERDELVPLPSALGTGPPAILFSISHSTAAALLVCRRSTRLPYDILLSQGKLRLGASQSLKTKGVG